jgi:hypothetical protein
MSHAQMIARAWLDDSFRAALIAQGIEVPPRPTDLADEELDTSATRCDDSPEGAFMTLTFTKESIACGGIG